MYWLNGFVDVLLHLIAEVKDAPSYLSAYLPELSDVSEHSWNAAALHWGREMVNESIDTAGEISETAMLFQGRVRLARLEAAEGHTDTALDLLHMLLAGESDEFHQCVICYWTWEITRSADDRTETLRALRSIPETKLNEEDRRMIKALSES